MPLSIALVDEQLFFREGFKALAATDPELQVVGEAGDAREAYSLVDTTRPDVVVIDVQLPGASGITAARELLRRHMTVRILMFSAHSSEYFVVQSLQAGALGYALKEQAPAEVFDAIRAVAQGRTYLSPKISRFVVEDCLRLRRGDSPQRGPLDILSAREREVFDLLLRAFTNEQIAAQLCISVKTVETHRAHILKKLRCHSVVELMRFGMRHGLVAD